MNLTFNNPTILLMFSGGLDSTAALYHLLTDIKYKEFDIHALHLNIRNVENRALAEKHACANIVKWLRANPKYRKFEYSECSIEYPAINEQFMFDHYVLSFFAGYFTSLSTNIKHVALGVNKDDVVVASTETIQNIFNSFHNNLKNANESYKIFPIIDYTKKELKELLPINLSSLTWSCRKPIYEKAIAKQCGQCKSCKQ